MQTNQYISAILAVDARLAAIRTDRQALDSKRAEALNIRNTVNEAQPEVQAAKGELETVQSEAFINGQDVDLAPYTARLTKAEKRLAEANKSATAARIALPRIAQKLEDLDSETTDLLAERKNHEREYWAAIKREEEDVYRSHHQGLCESLVRIMALDKKVHDLVGSKLYLALSRDGRLGVPNGKGKALPMSYAQFNDAYVREALESLEAVFYDSLTVENEISA